MLNKVAGLRLAILATLMLTWILIAGATAKADPIVLTTTSMFSAGGRTLTSVTFTGATPGSTFQVVCLCPGGGNVGVEGEVDLNGNGFMDHLAADAATQTSFFIQITPPNSPALFYGPFGVSESKLNLTGQTKQPEPNCTPEPTTMLLLGTGLAGFAIKTRKRLKSHKRVQRS
jgi:hypothetical protein